MPDLWFPGAQRLPGPARKTSGTYWPKKGAVYHSAELNLQGTLNVLQDVRPKANGSLPGSWHFTNAKDAQPLIQHYALDVITWHARGGNTANFGVENEGYAGEPLTEHQIAKLASLTAWAKKVCGWGELSRGPSQNLFEHNEIGKAARSPYITACPSGRIPWPRIMVLAEEDNMDAAQLLQAYCQQPPINREIAEYGARMREAASGGIPLTHYEEQWLVRFGQAIERKHNRPN